MAQYYGNVHFLGVARISSQGGVVVAHLSYNTETDINGPSLLTAMAYSHACAA